MVALVIYHRDGNLSILDDFPVVDTIPSKIDFGIWDTFEFDVPAPFVYCC